MKSAVLDKSVFETMWHVTVYALLLHGQTRLETFSTLNTIEDSVGEVSVHFLARKLNWT